MIFVLFCVRLWVVVVRLLFEFGFWLLCLIWILLAFDVVDLFWSLVVLAALFMWILLYGIPGSLET